MEEIKDDELDEILKQREHQKQQETLTEEQKYRIEKEAQAKTVFNNATENPKALINASISQRSLDLINGEEFKDEVDEVARGNVKRVINNNKGQNRKDDNSNFYLGREGPIEALGGDDKTSVDRQITMYAIYTIWWYLFMISFGLFLVAPLKVLMNWAQALSPEIITSIEEGGQTRTEKIKKLHWLPGIFCFIFYLAYLAGFIYLGILIF